VVETFLALVELTFERIDKVYLLGDKLGLSRQGFVEEVRRCLIDPPAAGTLFQVPLTTSPVLTPIAVPRAGPRLVPAPAEEKGGGGSGAGP
jgi:hypothetical protein